MNDEIEVRSFKVELSAESEAAPRINGYAAVFGERSIDVGGFIEEIDPGFFDDVLTGDTRALFNHDRNFVLGRKSNGTLDMAQDAKGLRVQIVPPATDLIQDLVLTPMKRGDINQMSFSFRVKPKGDDWRMEGGQLIRTLKKGGASFLGDVSVVTEPAYPQTSAAVRSKVETLRQGPPADSQAASGGAEAKVRHAARRRQLALAERKLIHKSIKE